MSNIKQAGTYILNNIKSTIGLLDSKPEQANLNEEYKGVKDSYPQINNEVEVAEKKGLEDNASLFKQQAVLHSHQMDSKYGKSSDSKERKHEEGYFDGVVSRVCKFVNDHPKMLKAVKIGATAAAAVCGAATAAFPPAAVGAVAFGGIAGAIEVAQNVADKRKLKSMEKEVAKKGDEFTNLNEQIKAQENAIKNLEQRLNEATTKPQEAKKEIEQSTNKEALPFIVKEDIKHCKGDILNAMKEANENIPNDSTFKPQAIEQNKQIEAVIKPNAPIH